jgi:hypothetical protein
LKGRQGIEIDIPKAVNILAYGMFQKCGGIKLKWVNIINHHWNLNL